MEFCRYSSSGAGSAYSPLPTNSNTKQRSAAAAATDAVCSSVDPVRSLAWPPLDHIGLASCMLKNAAFVRNRLCSTELQNIRQHLALF